MLMKKDIRLLLAMEQELFRNGLALQLKKEDHFDVVGEVEDGVQAVDQTALLAPHVVIMDVLLPVLDGISACKKIRTLHPQSEVLFLTSVQNEEQMRRAFESGARGYLAKGCSFEELTYAIRKAAEGDYYLSGQAGHDMVAEFVKPALQSQPSGGIMTQRERELAKLLADGYSTKEAAAVLKISPKTAETHRASIMKKLNARNVTDIVKYCIRNYLIEP